MSGILEGDICLLEQEKIKGVVDKIKEEMPLGLNHEYWDRLQDIIYFKNDGKVTKAWSNFLTFVLENSKNIFDADRFNKITSDLKRKYEYELIIDENFCRNVNINIKLINDEFIRQFVNPIRILLNEWNDRVTGNHKDLCVNLDEWASLCNGLRTSLSVFLTSLWENLLSEIVFELKSKSKEITIDFARLCYGFEI